MKILLNRESGWSSLLTKGNFKIPVVCQGLFVGSVNNLDAFFIGSAGRVSFGSKSGFCLDFCLVFIWFGLVL